MRIIQRGHIFSVKYIDIELLKFLGSQSNEFLIPREKITQALNKIRADYAKNNLDFKIDNILEEHYLINGCYIKFGRYPKPPNLDVEGGINLYSESEGILESLVKQLNLPL